MGVENDPDLTLTAIGKTLVRMAHNQKPEVDFIDSMTYDTVCKDWKGGPYGR